MLPSSAMPGNTRVDTLSLPGLAFPIMLKREDTNPSGSQKDRSILTWVQSYIGKGINRFTISSSGNAVISLLFYAKFLPMSVIAYLTPKIQPEKLARLAKVLGITHLEPHGSQDFHLADSSVTLVFTEKPVSEAFKTAKNNGYQLLTSAKDDASITGYASIATELKDLNISDIFIPASSGATAVGIFEGYNAIHQSTTTPRFHIVQTAHVNILVREFDTRFNPAESSLASAIVDKIGHRAERVAEIIRETSGSGWAIDDTEIVNGMTALAQAKITNVSEEAGMLVGALYKATVQDKVLEHPLLLISGVYS